MISCFFLLLSFKQELELYDKRLIGRPALLAINKMDRKRSHYLLEEFKRKMENWKGINFQRMALVQTWFKFEPCIILSFEERGRP